MTYVMPARKNRCQSGRLRLEVGRRSLCSNLLNAELEMRLLADVVSYTVIIAYRPMRFSHVNFKM